MTEIQQIECRDESGSVLITNVADGPALKRGQTVTFKETGEIRWKISQVYARRRYAINRGWGLDLPKSERTER